MTLELARAEVLYALALLPVWLWWVWPRSGGAARFTWAGRPSEDRRSRDPRGFVLLLAPRVLRAAAVGLLLVTLSGPIRVERVTEEEVSSGMAIALALDLSTSMLAQDMDGRSRMNVARSAALRFAEGRPGDELALVGFAGEAFTRIPPTEDHTLLASAVESLDVDVIRNGTDLSGAILTATRRVLESDKVPRVVILVSDGAHNAAGVAPLAAARAAAATGVRVYSIGIVPGSDAPGDLAGSTPLPPEESDALATVLTGAASITGGRYFEAATPAALDSVYAQIDRLETPRPQPVEREIRHPLGPQILLVVLALVGLEALIVGSRWGLIP